jgi:hypothetical protein
VHNRRLSAHRTRKEGGGSNAIAPMNEREIEEAVGSTTRRIRRRHGKADRVGRDCHSSAYRERRGLGDRFCDRICDREGHRNARMVDCPTVRGRRRAVRPHRHRRKCIGAAVCQEDRGAPAGPGTPELLARLDSAGARVLRPVPRREQRQERCLQVRPAPTDRHGRSGARRQRGA